MRKKSTENAWEFAPWERECCSFTLQLRKIHAVLFRCILKESFEEMGAEFSVSIADTTLRCGVLIIQDMNT